MDKVLSIVIPVYNTEKYLERCLDSLLSEEINDLIEIIIVNDGSKDNSINIAKKYLKCFPNTVKLIDKENGGHGSTINAGLKVATGKYFRVIDSDDWVNIIDYKTYVLSLKNEDADLVVTNYSKSFIFNSTTEKIKYKDLVENKLYYFDKIDLKILHGEYFVMATSTYKTKVVIDSGLHMLEKTPYVDMQYNIEIMTRVKTFKYYDLDIYRYFIGRPDQSMNMNSFIKNQDKHETVLKYLINYYEVNKNKFSKNLKLYLKMILKYMTVTNYSIYCIYDNNHKNAYYKIKIFDKYLKEKNLELYNSINTMTYIKLNRKTNFIFVRLNGVIFQKTISFIGRFRRYK